MTPSLTWLRIVIAVGFHVEAQFGWAGLICLCGDRSGWSQYIQTSSAGDTVLVLAGVVLPTLASLCLLCLLDSSGPTPVSAFLL